MINFMTVVGWLEHPNALGISNGVLILGALIVIYILNDGGRFL